MKKIQFLILLNLLFLAGCSNENSDDDIINPPVLNIDKQDVINQNFSIVRIGASGPDRNDIVAAPNGLTMPSASGAFYRTQTGLNKTVISFNGTVTGGDNGNNIPNYPGANAKSYKSIAFFVLNQQDIDNGVVPNGKLVKNSDLDTQSTGIGNDDWGAAMHFLNSGSYTIVKTDNSDIMGRTTTNEVIKSVRYDDVPDGVFPSQFDKLATRLNSTDMSFNELETVFNENEVLILIMETVQNIDNKRTIYRI